MKIKPLHDRVAIKRLDDERTSAGGIVIPDTADKEKPAQGKIAAVGPGKRNDKGELKYPPIKANNEIARIISLYPTKVNNYSASTEGFRSKQITKANVSTAAGPYMQPTQGEEKKPGWFSRNILRKKSQSVTD